MTEDELYNTERCPVAELCESCGSDGPGLQAVPAGTQLGVLCLTLCPGCSPDRTGPLMMTSTIVGTIVTVVRLVGEHCAHVGATVDGAAEVLEALR